MSELRDVIELAYRVFDRYRRPDGIDYCDHCENPYNFQPLLSEPLRGLSAEDLDVYVSSVLYTCGSLEDFKHFLPRILELLPDAPFTSGPEAVLGKLSHADWASWPADEKAVIDSYLWAYWREGRRRSDRAHEALCSIALASRQVGPFLAEWLQDRSPEAVNARVQFVLTSIPALGLRGRLPNAYWWGTPNWRRMLFTG